MKIKSLYFKSFKRFTDFSITSIPESAKMVILIGPNGCGKSSILEGIACLYGKDSNSQHDNSYYHKSNPVIGRVGHREALPFVTCSFHGDGSQHKRSSVIPIKHTPYLPIPDTALYFVTTNHEDGATNMAGNCKAESTMRRIVDAALDGELTGNKDIDSSHFWMKFNASIARVLGKGVMLSGVGGGSHKVRFTKAGWGFSHNNLSAGEMNVVSILGDLHLAVKTHTDTVFFIDEIDALLHTNAQEGIVREVYDIIPEEGAQVWITAHSPGVFQAARDIEQKHPGKIVFIDMTECDFDQGGVEITPSTPAGPWTKNMLSLFLGSTQLSNLTKGKILVFCEGNSKSKTIDDASVYSIVFGDTHKNMKFESVGGHTDVESHIKSVNLIISMGTSIGNVCGIIDLDDKGGKKRDKTDIPAGVWQLTRNNIEEYLFDDEVVECFCNSHGLLSAQKKEILSKIENVRGHKGSLDHNKSKLIIETMRNMILEIYPATPEYRIFVEKEILPCIKKGQAGFQEIEDYVLSCIEDHCNSNVAD